eukprot:Lithocolla_globosa_v1_NODE_132_length_5923_cov_39.615883.p9 type:complete len:117 gc:universal NODE_132_length_5923_cov_39.615883:3997-4347(+)
MIRCCWLLFVFGLCSLFGFPCLVVLIGAGCWWFVSVDCCRLLVGVGWWVLTVGVGCGWSVLVVGCCSLAVASAGWFHHHQSQSLSVPYCFRILGGVRSGVPLVYCLLPSFFFLATG